MVQTTTVFYSVIKYGKFALLTALLVLSFINGHKDYISENPRKFMWDCFTVAVTAALGISVVAYMRDQTQLVPNLAFLSFFLFFTYNVFRELSGFNKISESTVGATQLEGKELGLFGTPVTGALIGLMGFMFVLALAAHVPHPQGFGALLKEAAVMGTFTAIGEGVLARNHGANVGKAVGLNFVLFSLAHIFLQLGGFYDHVFPPLPTLQV